MAEGLQTPDGTPAGVPVDAESGEGDFHRLMAGAADGSSPDGAPAAPPKREPRTDAEPPKTRRARPAKSERARTRDAKPGDAKPGKGGKPAELAPKDFRADLQAVGDGVWLAASQISVAAPYAALVHMHQPALIDAINSGAQVNPGVRNAVEKLTSGTGSAWALQLGIVGVNIAMQGWALLKDPEMRRQVAEANAQQVQAYMAQMGAVKLEAEAEARAEVPPEAA